MKVSGYCCSRCGQFRRVLLAACSCGFVPDSYVERAKSLILSTEYVVGDTYRGHSREQLAEASARTRDGAYVFDPLEVSEVAAFLEHRERELGSITHRAMAQTFADFAAPWLAALCGVGAIRLAQQRASTFAVLVVASVSAICIAYLVYQLLSAVLAARATGGCGYAGGRSAIRPALGTGSALPLVREYQHPIRGH